MKKFFSEFKTFITRGNVIDMAVGVTVGSAFTAIVNAVSTNILKPLINYVIGLIISADSLSQCYTYLKKVNVVGTGEIDLEQSIFIDWGAVINAVINFLAIAFVLFCIVKAINAMAEAQKEMSAKIISDTVSTADKKEMKKQGISLRDKEAVKTFMEAKKLAIEAAKAEEEEKARLEREANPTAEELLKKIVVLLESK